MPIADTKNGAAAPPQQAAERRALMAVLACADTSAIESALHLVAHDVAARDLRPAEVGLVMLRGRIGGDGAPFNVGEATVTRAAVELSTGERGFAYVFGRDHKKAKLAALCDALLQSDQYRHSVNEHILGPLQAGQRDARTKKRAQTAATRVDFFTLVRGEDPS